jgi:DNA replication and repair protein RecF
VALALRLASYETLQTDQSGEPILILDDVFAELDAVRRERLAQIASRSAGQVLITAAVSDDVPEQLSGVRFFVDNATIGELR